MESQSLLNREKNLKKLFVSLSLVVLTAGCKLKPLKIDPCGAYPHPLFPLCLAVPLNQPQKPEYDREIKPSDICVTSDEYAQIQKYTRELIERCGDKCQ